MTSIIRRDVCFKKDYDEVFSGFSIRTLFCPENESVWQVTERIRWSDPSIVVHFDVKQQTVTRTTQDKRTPRKRGWIGSSISCSILFMCCSFNGVLRSRNAHRRTYRTFICLVLISATVRAQPAGEGLHRNHSEILYIPLLLCEQQPKLRTQNLTCVSEVQNDDKYYVQIEE